MVIKLLKYVLELILVLTFTFIIGALIGFIQEEFAEGDLLGFGIVVGAIMSTIVGSFTYYMFLRKNLTVTIVVSVTLLYLFAGAVSAYYFKIYTMIFTPLVLFVIGLVLYFKRINSTGKSGLTSRSS